MRSLRPGWLVLVVATCGCNLLGNIEEEHPYEPWELTANADPADAGNPNADTQPDADFVSENNQVDPPNNGQRNNTPSCEDGTLDPDLCACVDEAGIDNCQPTNNDPNPPDSIQLDSLTLVFATDIDLMCQGDVQDGPMIGGISLQTSDGQSVLGGILLSEGVSQDVLQTLVDGQAGADPNDPANVDCDATVTLPCTGYFAIQITGTLFADQALHLTVVDAGDQCQYESELGYTVGICEIGESLSTMECVGTILAINEQGTRSFDIGYDELRQFSP